MNKIAKYFLISASIVLITGLIIVAFFIKTIYRSFTSEGNNFPPLITSFLERIKPKEKKVIVLRAEETLKVLEGWTTRDIGNHLEEFSLWSKEDFFSLIGAPLVDYRKNKKLTEPKDFSSEFSFLKDKPHYRGLEGYLFPDTYRVYASSSVEEITRKMLANLDDKLTPKMRADINAQGKTIYEIITLASLVEKEAPIDYQTNDNHDAKIIAGIFLNRLAIGQGLQSDATLSYIYGDNKPAHSGTELEIDSLYNSYKYRGLPPGPICNPGILAIEAAIYPLATDYNYFLTPKGKSTVIYAKTYEEHLKNKYQYLK
ncbi:MAG: endolytic transglycosylase MltG [Patescibacteria group bacterium]